MQTCANIFSVVQGGSTDILTQRCVARPSYSRLLVQQRQQKTKMNHALANGSSKESVHPHIDHVLFTPGANTQQNYRDWQVSSGGRGALCGSRKAASRRFLLVTT